MTGDVSPIKLMMRVGLETQKRRHESQHHWDKETAGMNEWQ
jgi:hypothetical protein